MSLRPKLVRFDQNVKSKYQLYNSIFTTLPFDAIIKTGTLLPLFHETCEKGFAKGDDATTIVNTFFEKYQARRDDTSQLNLLFRFIQYVERQVVLFDAIEDAAFTTVNNMAGVGTIRNLKENAVSTNKKEELQKYLEAFKVRIVLTAHPTQFYPGAVLGIITDLTRAIKTNDLSAITNLLAQLGKTPFLKRSKPTPYDEAVSLIWYLENVFYYSFGEIFDYIQQNIFDDAPLNNDIINIGFWPGGDRDGNPYVTADTTVKVANRLKETILKNYYRDIRKLKRKLTFRGVEEKVAYLEEQLYSGFINLNDQHTISLKELREGLKEIKEIIRREHQSLYINDIDSLLNKIQLFGYHFATLDIRQDSRVHQSVFTEIIRAASENDEGMIFPKNYNELSDEDQIEVLSNLPDKEISIRTGDNDTNKTIASIKAIKTIQENNGEKACNRYIISNNQTVLNVMQVYAMLKLFAFPKKMPVDVVPLFETVNDLQNAPLVMETLYTNKAYGKHLKERGNVQTIMLGFSDGTKDGGYLMANWAIFKAKEALTAVSRKHGIEVIFFDGRGGPPARGGGKTHQFYASLGPTIADKEVQLTIQGQTISSNFGTLDSSQYNLEQLISSGIYNRLSENRPMTETQIEVMNRLAEMSYKKYVEFKGHPKFVPYLEHMSTLKYYAKTNISSRPTKRDKGSLDFDDLRAIPFVGSWSQLKQNVPGFFGVGTALKHYEEQGDFKKVKELYNQSKFFKTLIENSMMSLSKSFLDLTKYMAEDPEYGPFWKIIYKEYHLSKEMILKLTGYRELMQNQPAGKASIDVREAIVLPLLTIQQYALRKIHELEKEPEKNAEEITVYEKLVTRSLFGNINASRNSA